MDDYQNVQPVGGPVGGNLTLPPQQKKSAGMAIASLILGIVSIFGLCCCFLNVITAPIAIILGIIVLVSKRSGTGLAITGIVFSALSLLVVISVFMVARQFMPYSETIMKDYVQLVQDKDEVFPAYEKDGTIPEYLEKYKESPYTDLYEKYDITFEDIMDSLLLMYKEGKLPDVDAAVMDSFSIDDDPGRAILIPAFAG